MAEEREETVVDLTNIDDAAGVGIKDLKSFEAISREGVWRTLQSVGWLARNWGGRPLKWTIGTSCVIFRVKIKGVKLYICFNVEGLGSKNLATEIIRTMDGFAGMPPEELARVNYENGVSNVLMSLNDLIVHGGLPWGYGEHVECGDEIWLQDLVRAQAITDGTADICIEGGALWALGETAQLQDIVYPGVGSLSGASLGGLPPGKKPFKYTRVRPGDHILMLASSGVHSNGLTKIREMVDDPKVDFAYDKLMPDGRLFGEAILVPTRQYVDAVAALHEANIRATSCHNITGDAFARPLRHGLPVGYVITTMLPRQPEFEVIQQAGGFTDKQYYKAANNGTGFMYTVRAKDADNACLALEAAGYTVIDGGEVVALTGDQQPFVELDPLGVKYTPGD